MCIYFQTWWWANTVWPQKEMRKKSERMCMNCIRVCVCLVGREGGGQGEKKKTNVWTWARDNETEWESLTKTAIISTGRADKDWQILTDGERALLLVHYKCVCVSMGGGQANLHQRWSKLHWVLFKPEWANELWISSSGGEKLVLHHMLGGGARPPLLLFHSEKYAFGRAVGETEKAERGRRKTSVWHLSECNFYMFSANWAERYSNYASRHSNHNAIKSRQLCCNMRKNQVLLMLSWTAENTLTECQRETSQKTDGENMQFKECNLSRKLPQIDRNCLNFLKISVVTPRLLSSMPEMSNGLNLFIFKVPLWDVSLFSCSPSLHLDLISSGFGRPHLVVLFIYTWMKLIWGPLWQTCVVIQKLFKEA